MERAKAEIERRLAANLNRVASLLEIHGRQGRRGALPATDILRAAVVLLHASLEDLIRTVLAWRLPDAGTASFEDMPFAGGRATKLTLAELATHRGRSVDDLVRDAVEHSLERSTYNNRGDLAVALRRMGIADTVLTSHLDNVASMMARRHLIVHRADSPPLIRARRHSKLHALDRGAVLQWAEAVRQFGSALLRQC